MARSDAQRWRDDDWCKPQPCIYCGRKIPIALLTSHIGRFWHNDCLDAWEEQGRPVDPTTGNVVTEPMKLVSLHQLEATEKADEALREIASYNPDELREWEEENAADMVEIARAALQPFTQENNESEEERDAQQR